MQTPLKESHTQPTPATDTDTTVPDASIQAEDAGLQPESDHIQTAHLPGGPVLYRQPGRHQRAGFTKSKGRGTPKAKRRMAKTSRQRNRGKR